MSLKKMQKQKEYRPPVVALLGHVDHGKTTILDAICRSAVAAHEVGGITQGISVYSVLYKNRDITFVDTPGHEAFDLMRTRGGNVADVVLLVVAANDGVMPQTKESIQVILSANKPCIVVINKVDIAGVNIEKVKRDLSAAGITVESLGGDVPSVEISAKNNVGIDGLLEMIQLLADVSEVSGRAPRKDTLGEAMVLESSKDKSIGNVATLIVTAGSFTKGRYIGYYSQKQKKTIIEKVKGFVDAQGNPLEVVKEGYGAEIIGLSGNVSLGTVVYCIKDSKSDISKVLEEDQKIPEGDVLPAVVVEGEAEAVAGEDLLSMMLGARDEEREARSNLRVIIKAGTQGALDAILTSLEESVADGLIEISESGTGDITVNDIEHAMGVKSIVVGFRVQIDSVAGEIAAKNKVLAKVYEIIYELTDEVEDVAAALQMPNEREEILGTAKVKKIFILSNGSRVIGTRIESGELKQGALCKLKRGEMTFGTGKIISMRCEKDTIHSAIKGGDCGLVLDMKEEILDGDILECYRVVKS